MPFARIYSEFSTRRPVLYALYRWVILSALIVLQTLRTVPSKLASVALILFALVFFLVKSRSREKRRLFPDRGYLVFGALAVLGFAVQFYPIFNGSSLIGRVSTLTGIEERPLYLTLTLCLSVLAVPGIGFLVEDIIERVYGVDGSVLHRLRFARNPFLIFCTVYGLAVTAIIRANFNYIDDAGRCFYGYSGWNNFSRFASNYLSTFVHGNSFLADVSPLTQLLAVVLMASSSVIVLYVFTGKKKYTLFQYCAVVPLCLSPYFLECLSYKYDSPYMSLSIFASVFPALFFSGEKENRKKLLLASFAGTMLNCLTYQVALGIFPMLVVFLAAQSLIHGKEASARVFSAVGTAAFGYFLAVLYYKIVVVIPTAADDYVSGSMPPVVQLFPTIISNYRQYFELIQYDFNLPWKILLLILAVGFPLRMVLCGKGKRMQSLILTLLAEAVSAVLIFGLYPLLEKPLFETRAFFGLGAWIAFVSLSTLTDAEGAEHCSLQKACILALSWSFFAFAFIYGNALSAQKEYLTYRSAEIMSGINAHYTDSATKKLKILGDAGLAPTIRNSVEHYPVLSRLTPRLLRENWSWGNFSLSYYYRTDLIADNLMEITDELPLLLETGTYSLYGDAERIVVKLN